MMKTPKPCPLSAADLFDFFDLLDQRDRYGARSLRARETRRFRSHWLTLRDWIEEANGVDTARKNIAERLLRSKWKVGRKVGCREFYRILWVESKRQCDAERMRGPEHWHGAK